MWNLTEYSNNYSETSGNLWYYYKDEPALTDASIVTDLSAANDSASSKFE